jgi:translation initiation factor IF-2
MKNKLILASITPLLVASFAFAHDVLKSLTVEQMTQVQANLITKGYLKKEDVTVMGTYNAKTEAAFDAWQNDKEKAEIKKNQATDTNMSDDEQNDEQPVNVDANVDAKVNVSFWGWVVLEVKSFFGIK